MKSKKQLTLNLALLMGLSVIFYHFGNVYGWIPNDITNTVNFLDSEYSYLMVLFVGALSFLVVKSVSDAMKFKER